ncbi:hypothetical protein KL864_33515 [Mycolicibacterium goodii]|uniref:hypothetical protein n=1 Tax=Mycolicibacterium goodii TaxID=134601 RepID=UPI001BDC0E48|nr:hypothetical protein [Mycolicibacterium goodii]MBU8820789.1 hypothetical protein [Mycolicibacterium goodii]
MYCAQVDSEAPDPHGGAVVADEQWLVAAGDPASTIAGALRITSRRHFIHFADMTAHEVTGFGTLLARLDAALRTVTDAERVHHVSTATGSSTFMHGSTHDRPNTPCGEQNSSTHRKAAIPVRHWR